MEIKDKYLVCDNPNCYWQITGISLSEMYNYLNQKCPKCGLIVLTESDFDDFLKIMAYLDSLPKSDDTGNVSTYSIGIHNKKLNINEQTGSIP